MNFLPIIKSVIGQSPSGAPSTPTGLTLTGVNPETLNASWNTVVGATYYEYKIARTEVDLGAARWVRVSTTNVVLGDLISNTEYFVVVRSGNSSGTSNPTSAVSATTEEATIGRAVMTGHTGVKVARRIELQVQFFGATDGYGTFDNTNVSLSPSDAATVSVSHIRGGLFSVVLQIPFTTLGTGSFTLDLVGTIRYFFRNSRGILTFRDFAIIFDQVTINYNASVVATFPAVSGVLDTTEPSIIVNLDRAATNFGVSDIGLADVTGNGATDVSVSSVTAHATVDNRYIVALSLPLHRIGVVEVVIAASAMVTVSGQSVSLTGNFVQISYDTNLVDVTIGETTVNNVARTARTVVTFEEYISSSSLRQAISHSGVNGIRFSIGIGRQPRITTSGVTFSREHVINWVLPEGAEGTVSFTISGRTQSMGASLPQSPFPQTVETFVETTSSFDLDTRDGVTAGITAPPLPITGTSSYVDVRFSSVISDFTTGDVDISGDDSADVAVTSITALPDGTAGRDYRVNLSIVADTKGMAEVDITGNVMVSSESVPVLVGSVIIRWDNVTPISATMSVPMPGRLDTTAVSRVTFERPINVDSFATGDISVTAPMGVVVRNVVRVNTGGTRDFEFDITFALPANQAATASFDITGTVTEGTVERIVTATQQDFTFNTVPRTIAATFANFPTVSVGGNFTADVQFMTPNTDDVITGFTAGDVSLSGDTTGLTDYTIAGVPGRAHDFRIHFTPSVDTEGTVNIGIAGTVLVDGVIHAVIITPIAVQYDTRNAIMAAWNGIDGIKRASPFTIELAFSGSEDVAIPDSTHFDITRISGDTIANLGISDYTIRRKTGSNQIFELIFTPADNVEGVFEIDATGRFNVGARGSQVMRDVSVPPARISVNTTNTIPQPIFDPSTIPTPIWDYLGDSDYTPPTEINQAGVDAFFRLSFGENVTGLTTDEIIEAGVENRTITLFRVVGNNRVLHTDPSVPHHLFDVAVRINANQHGVLTLAVGRNAVVSVDDNTPGPIVPIQRAGIPFDTRPTAAPIHIVRWDLPDMPSDGATVTASVYFSRALVAPESLLPSDIELDGITGASVRSVDVNASDPTRYDIVINIPLGSRGNLNISIVGM